jgi:hypothetical protein
VKKHLPFLVCILALFTSAPVAASAQQAGTIPGLGPSSSWPSPEEIVAKLDHALSLSDQQKAALTPIITNRQQQLKALAADNTDPPRVKQSKLQSIYVSSELKINAVLNMAQKRKYAAMEQQMRNQAMQRGQPRRANGSHP